MPNSDADTMARGWQDITAPIRVGRRSWNGPLAVLLGAVLWLGSVLGFGYGTVEFPRKYVAPFSAADSVTLANPAPKYSPVPPMPPRPRFGHMRRLRHEIEPVPPTPMPTTPPVTPATPLFTAAEDVRLLDGLAALGYVITNPAKVIGEAHRACRLIREGEEPSAVDEQFAQATGDETLAIQLVSSAQLSYPNCY